MLERGDGQRELGHRVQVVGAAVDKLGDEGWDVASGGPLGGEVADLLLARHLTRQEEPEETFRQGLLTAGSLGEKLLAFRDGLAAEADTLLRVEDGALPDQGLDATGAAVDLVERHLTDHLAAIVLSQPLDLVNLLGKAGGEGFLETLWIKGTRSASVESRFALLDALGVQSSVKCTLTAFLLGVA